MNKLIELLRKLRPGTLATMYADLEDRHTNESDMDKFDAEHPLMVAYLAAIKAVGSFGCEEEFNNWVKRAESQMIHDDAVLDSK